MKEKLPKVFANKIEKKIKNNEEIYKTNNIDSIKRESEQKEKLPKQKIKKEKTIQQKINDIINSKKYTYKIPVKIKLKNEEELITNIIGKNKINIITINNELIKIDDISDIEENEKNE